MVKIYLPILTLFAILVVPIIVTYSYDSTPEIVCDKQRTLHVDLASTRTDFLCEKVTQHLGRNCMSTRGDHYDLLLFGDNSVYIKELKECSK